MDSKYVRKRTIQRRKDQIAILQALLEQREKMWEDQYPLRSPRDNEMRMHDLEVQRFRIEMYKWELEQYINEGTDFLEEDS